jgi:hypothetical protein
VSREIARVGGEGYRSIAIGGWQVIIADAFDSTRKRENLTRNRIVEVNADD